ncbi:uncharacterized protein [Parasteatoda tepidariorum]|uniref:uncharacterized protein n=1 Tax=Parasteatoda tepidariorum TaxID=114398 RepID=UPI001C718EDA|nr:uncharacterized protein LOC107444404 [Parasteatoda tepidariorum]
MLSKKKHQEYNRKMENIGHKRSGEISCKVQCKKVKIESSKNVCYIDYISQPPSLESITLTSISIRLWTEPDISEDVKQHSMRYGSEIICTDPREAYHKLEERVTEKLADLCLPDLLKIKVSDVIRPIGLQLLKCFDSKDDEYCKVKDLSEKHCTVYWTAEGIIDKRRSLVELIKNENQENSICQLYELACKYCLEEYVFSLWENIPLDKKITYISSERATLYNHYGYDMIDYWTAYINDELPSLLSKIKKTDHRNIYDCNLSIHHNMVTLSIFVCNEFSLRYFWHKLTAEQKEANMENWIEQIIQKYNRVLSRKYEYQNYHVFTNILCFLLSHLKDQNQVFQTHSETILKALFFDWPYQRFFISTINLMFDYLEEDTYTKTMTYIVREIKEGRNTVELFRKIWRRSPVRLKNACLPVIVNGCHAIRNLLSVEDLETINLVLTSFSANDKKEVIFNLIGSEELRKLLYLSKFTLLDSLAKNTLPSDCDIKRFRESLEQKYGDGLYHKWILGKNFQAVDKMLKWVIEIPEEIESFKKNGLNKFSIYTSLICLGDFGLIDRFMNWCFESVDESNSFKQSYVRNSTACIQLLQGLGHLGENGWDFFEEFLKYSSFSTEIVANFKKLCLEQIASLVDRYYFEFAMHLLHWCLDSSKEIKEFKNELFLSEEGSRIIFYEMDRKYPNWNNVKNILKWFSPLSRKSVDSLKRDLEDDEFSEDGYGYSPANKKKFFLHLLDNFKACNSTSDSDSSSGDDREFMEILNDSVGDDDDPMQHERANKR